MRRAWRGLRSPVGLAIPRLVDGGHTRVEAVHVAGAHNHHVSRRELDAEYDLSLRSTHAHAVVFPGEVAPGGRLVAPRRVAARAAEPNGDAAVRIGHAGRQLGGHWGIGDARAGFPKRVERTALFQRVAIVFEGNRRTGQGTSRNVTGLPEVR